MKKGTTDKRLALMGFHFYKNRHFGRVAVFFCFLSFMLIMM